MRDERAWYPAREFHVKQVPVVLRIMGEDVVGWAIFTPSGEPRWRVGSLREYTKLPRHACVDAWRPIDEQQWPHPLPEPVKMMEPPDWQSATPAHEPVSDDGESWWVNPDIRLGRAHEPPETVRECEARILRYLRTFDAMQIERSRGGSACWPPALLKAAREVEQMLRDARTGRLSFLRDEDYADINDEPQHARSRPAPWRPTPRDVSEYEAGRVPRWIPQGGQRLFAWRASRPPYSWAQIADVLRVPVEMVREDYEYQCERAFEKAK